MVIGCIIYTTFSKVKVQYQAFLVEVIVGKMAFWLRVLEVVCGKRFLLILVFYRCS